MQLNHSEPEISIPIQVLSKPIFRFFVACEDEAAAGQVRAVQSQLGARCENRIGFVNDFRHFAEFRDEESRKTLVLAAMEADIIVISSSGRDRLADELKLWLEEIPALEKGQTALVTLFDPAAANWEQQRQIGYFREVAENHGWDFFSNIEEWRRESVPEPLFDRLEVFPLGESDSFHIPIIWESWGIND